jgi:pSer/pThr/pTyr-binding forkhead associated (FHA) protein
MSAVLVIAREKVQINKVAVDHYPFVVGRSSRCDLPLTDNQMSREHFAILSEGGVFKVEDKGSRNGTEVNGKLISEPVILKDGDQITVGSFQLTFYAAGGEQLGADEVDEDLEATRFVGDDDLKKAKKAADPKKPVAAGAVVKLVVTGGPLKGSVYKDWGEDLRLGRDEDNQVVLPDDAVSHRHARIYREGGNHVVEDLGSANGTFVGGVRLRAPHTLKHGDKIRIGTASMEYSEVDPARIKKMRIRIVAGVVGLILILLIAKLFRPEDKAARYAAQGYDLLKQKKYTEAIAVFEKGVQENPTQELKTGLSKAKSQAEAQQWLADAEAAALAENYEEARDLCHKVLRLHAEHAEAKAFLAVMKQVDDAKVAENARNWPDAVRLYENALNAYPNSAVLKAGLARCTQEQAARASLARADGLIRDKQYAEAEQALGGTATNSAYYAETVEKIATIQNLKFASEKFAAAQKTYRAGQVEEAQQIIREGLSRAPDYEDLVNLRNDIELITPLAKRLEGSEQLARSDNVDAIRDMVQECQAVMNIRAQSAEAERIKAKAAGFAQKLRERLREIATQETWAGDQRLAAGDKRGALIAYRKAAAADPGNQKAELAAAKLQKELSPLAKEHFQQALVHEELGQVDLAVLEFDKVLQISVPGDTYYDRAVQKLKKYR